MKRSCRQCPSSFLSRMHDHYVFILVVIAFSTAFSCHPPPTPHAFDRAQVLAWQAVSLLPKRDFPLPETPRTMELVPADADARISGGSPGPKVRWLPTAEGHNLPLTSLCLCFCVFFFPLWESIRVPSLPQLSWPVVLAIIGIFSCVSFN